MNASFLAAMVFVTVRALTSAEPPEKIVFNFCFIGTLISNVLTLASYTRTELSFLICTGLLANISQIFMSNAYKIAPPGQIGPMNYIAIIFCRHLGFYILAGNTGSIEFDRFCIGS